MPLITPAASALVAPRPVETPWLLDVLGDPAICFVAHGIPGPQGSKKEVGKFKSGPRKGRAIMVESSEKVEPWRRRVAKSAALTTARLGGWEPLAGALVADMVFTLDRPARFPKNKPEDLRWLHGRHTSYPDLSKLARSTEDALTGIVWHDDSRVCAYRRLEKMYVGQDDPDALREPGVVVRVWQVPA